MSKQHAYETVSNLQSKKPKSTIEIVPDSPENKINKLPTIEDIHDRSENESVTTKKTTMKNILYEPGRFIYLYIMC